MIYNEIKLVFLCSFMFLFFACTEDDETLINSENLIAASTLDRRGGGNNGGNGNNQDGQNEIANLDNEIVLQWTNLFLQLDRYATGMRPNATARALAYIHLAAYETANPAMSNYRSNEDLLTGLNIRRPNGNNIHWELALNSCYAIVLDHFLLHLPEGQRALIGQLASETEESLVGNVSTRFINDSKEWGEDVANRIIKYSQTDTDAEAQILEPQPNSYEPPVGDGYWTYSADQERALFPYWESVRTFTISPEETTAIDPITYSENPSSPYYQQMAEVYGTNNRARDEDGEELWIAEFWSDDVENLVFSPPARQVSIAHQLIEQRDLNLEESLVLLLKLGFSLNDAAVSTWKYKYEFMVMRPNVFIHEFIDPTYQTNLYRLVPWPNPTFPGYPSGHSAFASAAAGVFIDQFGSTANFTDRSHEGRTEFRGMPRYFETFEDMAEENGYSRLPLGVHIRMDCTEGLRLGYEISEAVNNYRLRRRDNS